MNKIITPPIQTITTQKNRIKFFDLAKGFCIFLVVVYHVSSHYDVELPASNIIKSIRLPLYFFLSGCFFKTYGGFADFLKRKLNKLLLPFLFWFCFSLGLAAFFYFIFDLKLFSYYELNIHSILANTFYGTYPNSPIWFLLCLFWVNAVFYIIHLVSDKFKIKTRPLVIGLSTLMIGLIGVIFSNLGIRIPFYIDSAFTAIPFFAFGYYFYRYTPLAKKNKLDKWIPLIVVLLLLTLYFVAPLYSLRKNTNINYETFGLVYLCGFMGTLSIILFSKMIQKLPVISYWGRYSIMILVSHGIVYRLVSILILSPLTDSQEMNSVTIFVFNMVLTMTICTFLIPFMKKYMPHVTAQKDIIKVG